MEFLNVGTVVINNYLLPCGEGYCLLDTGYPFDNKSFFKRLQKKGVALEKIHYVVLTHVHADHAGFLQELLKKTGATLIYITDDKERLLSGKNVEDVSISSKGNLFTSRISVALRKFTQTFPPVTYEKVVDAHKQPLLPYGYRFHFFKGHTSNDLCLQWGDKLFCGDLCMNGYGAVNHSPMWIEDNETLLNSWEELLKLDVTTLYPAHGKPFPLAELPDALAKRRQKKVYKL